MNRALALSFALCAVLFAWSSGLFAGVHFGGAA